MAFSQNLTVQGDRGHPLYSFTQSWDTPISTHHVDIRISGLALSWAMLLTSIVPRIVQRVLRVSIEDSIIGIAIFSSVLGVLMEFRERFRPTLTHQCIKFFVIVLAASQLGSLGLSRITPLSVDTANVTLIAIATFSTLCSIAVFRRGQVHFNIACNTQLRNQG